MSVESELLGVGEKVVTEAEKIPGVETLVHDVEGAGFKLTDEALSGLAGLLRDIVGKVPWFTEEAEKEALAVIHKLDPALADVEPAAPVAPGQAAPQPITAPPVEDTNPAPAVATVPEGTPGAVLPPENTGGVPTGSQARNAQEEEDFADFLAWKEAKAAAAEGSAAPPA